MAKKSTPGKRKFGQLYTVSSGRIQARYTGPDGVRHPAPMTFEDSDAATTWLLRERRLLEEDPAGWTPPKVRAAKQKAQAVTFGTFAERWLLTRKVKGRPLAGRMRDHYQDLVDRFILPSFEEKPVKQVTPEMIDDWYDTTAIDRPTYRARAYGLANAAVAGATIAELMALAGHSTPAAAMRYQHAARDRMQDLAKRLSKMAAGELGAPDGSNRPVGTA